MEKESQAVTSDAVANGILKVMFVCGLLAVSLFVLQWGYGEMQKPSLSYDPGPAKVYRKSVPPDPSVPDGTDDEEKNYVPPRRLTKAEGEALHKWFEQRRKERAAQRAGK